MPEVRAAVEHGEERRRREDGVQLHEGAVAERSLAFRADRENAAVVGEHSAHDHVRYRGLGTL